MRYGSLFTGIGGFDLGFTQAGMTCAWQVEIDKACLSLLDRRFPDAKRYTDVRECGSDNLAAVDLVCGGFPCQDLSIAGRRAGLAGERSGLWHEFHRIIAETKPRWVVIENVPGLLSSNKGLDFAVILRGLVECGYGAAWRVLDSQYFGVAQRRRRVFVVGHLGDGRAAEVLFEREGCSRDTPPRRETGQGVAGTLDRKSTSSNRGSQANETEFIVAGTLDSHSHKGLQGQDAYQDKLVTYSIRTANTQGLGFGLQEDVMGTLDDGRGFAISFIPGNSAQARSLGESYDVSVTVKGDGGGTKPHIAGQGVGVRRLTPVECERLQGFPDGWTEGQADSTRYRQLGNAVTVSVIRWLGNRIIEREG